MATRLGIYNEALRLLGARRLSSLTDNNKNRNTLDQIWTLDDHPFGLIRRCLSEGFWNYALRTSRLDFDSSIEPGFGYQFAFRKPDDYVRLVEISVDEYFYYPLRDYEPENDIWYLDNDQIYVRYVSDDSSYGLNLGKFPPNFTKYVACVAASEAAPTIAASKIDVIEQKLKRARINAKSKDAQEQSAKQPPQGSWANARTLGSGTIRRDGGSRNNLIG